MEVIPTIRPLCQHIVSSLFCLLTYPNFPLYLKTCCISCFPAEPMVVSSKHNTITSKGPTIYPTDITLHTGPHTHPWVHFAPRLAGSQHAPHPYIQQFSLFISVLHGHVVFLVFHSTNLQSDCFLWWITGQQYNALVPALLQHATAVGSSNPPVNQIAPSCPQRRGYHNGWYFIEIYQPGWNWRHRKW